MASHFNDDDTLEERFETCFEDGLENFSRRVAGKKKKKRAANIERDHEEGNIRLWNDYFSDDPVYHDRMFRRRFRMTKPLFLRIVQSLSQFPYFQQRDDATGKQGLSALQKCTAAIRRLAYGLANDAMDEYLRMGATTVSQALENFVDGIINLFQDEYLRRPTREDLERLLHSGKERGFPGMVGSIDCMHWEWKNCPTAWKGQYSRGHGKPTIVLEAVASQDLWIWHAFFGAPGTCNDINVLDRSPVFDDILEGRAPRLRYEVNGHQYKMGYYLTDGIYPKWATFIQSITRPQGPKASLFASCQEAVRKDVERAFGVLQARFAIIRNPGLFWDKERMGKIMRACIILHNMIVEDERDENTQFDLSDFVEGEGSGTSQVDNSFSTETATNVNNLMANRAQIRHEQTHRQLKEDLIEHIWQKWGQGN
ncbi:uncharacterized protein LOC9329205 [Arabidopsis lyrata subsp. lyrata]|uniref:uncharacterized protein LOC9329205 n=1 Tax=Arabidopsis lyrata subsp. lyrata TaxID=81972 RepID=UPI000A29B3A7|nr:uncharacterized protein LOC9329205 [Arabidopsis lyrata subsp. lyrata]|eukprot:XP_002893144.2 uncharacterized protein LOC9329205 [Arabidopsis lyrata subsp. lyrata]